MKIGEIFRAKNLEEHHHPIIFLGKLPEGKFKACIISTKDTDGNIKMEKSHFEEFDEGGLKYKYSYNNSHIVPYRVFEKETLWLESEIPQGKLTQKGIDFIEKYFKDIKTEYHPYPIWIEKP